MAKKIFYLVAMIWSLCASSQNAVGDWRIHTSFVGSEVTTVAESENWVYYLSGAHLFRLDKQTQENEALSKLNLLSDMVISNIYYNHVKDYLVIIYTNSNIDIILSDGSVVNMPEIKDVVMTSSKTVNDVTFATDKIYLATGFGYVVIDDTKFVIKESHLYNESLTSVAQAGELLLLSSVNKFYYGNADEYHDQLSSFNVAKKNKVNCLIRVINDESFYCITSRTYLTQISHSDDGSLIFETTPSPIIEAKVSDVQKTIGGFLLNVKDPSKRASYITDENGQNPVVLDSNGELCSRHPDGGDESGIWAAGSHGLHLLGSDNYYLPNALTMPQPFWMTYNKDKDILYVSSTGTNYFFRDSYPSQVNTFDGIQWDDVTPEGAPVGGSYWLEFMPGDPDTYFMSTWKNGLLKVKNNEIAYTYNVDNSPMLKQSGALHPITSVDRSGNIWCVQTLENMEHPVMALPAAKSKLSEVTINDWVTPVIYSDIFTGETTKRASFISTRIGNNDIKVFTDGDYQRPLFMWVSGGETPSTPQQKVKFNQLSDQDGQIVSWTYTMCLTEDLNGYVWMGTTEGVCMFNPAAAFSGSSFSVIRPKVPRDDGTGLADRLMDGIQVNDVAVDGANRKWIATQTSGLFLVNSDGTQIIKKFNTTNSPLATNTVYKVCCNPNSNSVYITTPAGLYEYFSDSSPAASNYDDIYAYPNPVRPDYAGDVTIMGLMDNSLVKIADASGHVIKQLKSTGGMATWDCCDQQGNMVKTGVYFVLCSQANGGNEAVVTKVAVIR